MVRILLPLAAFILAAFQAVSAETNPPPAAPALQSANQKTFQVKGFIKELKSDGKTVEIRHEEIPNYMPAMTMSFESKDPKELAELKPGDVVSFRLIVTDTDSWVDQIRKLSAAAPTEPTRSTIRIVRDVEPLQIGDPLPDYHFTNELGQAASLAQFKGKALALTFIFTRCPLPNFCPRMSSNFEAVQKKLLVLPNAPTNWHLLTLSFDPDFDTPVILKSYAERYGADPQHWSFITGEIIDITAISEQFGQMFWRDQGAINHNLRTVVVDAAGRVQKIFQGNNWSPDELVDEMVKAASANHVSPPPAKESAP
jgi:protein SCO1/2